MRRRGLRNGGVIPSGTRQLASPRGNRPRRLDLPRVGLTDEGVILSAAKNLLAEIGPRPRRLHPLTVLATGPWSLGIAGRFFGRFRASE
jgi:hypothetical protein